MKTDSLLLTALLITFLLATALNNIQPAIAQSFTIAASPFSKTHYQNGYVSYYVSVTPVGGFEGTVGLSVTYSKPTAAPDLYSCVILPPSVTVKGGDTEYAILTVVGPSTAVSAWYTYTFSIQGSSSGYLVQTTSCQLTVTPNPTGGDFYMKFTPTYAYITAGGTTSYGFDMDIVPGYTANVNLQVTGLPSGATGTFRDSGGTTITSTSPTATGLSLYITTAVSTSVGSFLLTVTGTGTTTQYYYLVLRVVPVGDFALSSSSTSATLTQGGTMYLTLTVQSSGGFSSPISISKAWTTVAPSGITTTLSTATVTPSAGGTASSTLTIAAASTAELGSFTLRITAKCYTLSHYVDIGLTVALVPEFSISASPTSLSVTGGSTGTSIITVMSIGSFSSAVSLAWTWIGTAPTDVTASLSPNPITPLAGQSTSSTLIVTTQRTSPNGTYTIRITGSSGSLSHYIDVTITITAPPAPPDFTISASPASFKVKATSTNTTTITITSTGGFNSAVTLTVSGLLSGVTATFSPTSVTPSAGGSVTSILTISTNATASVGTHSLTVTGTSSSISHQVTITLEIASGAKCIIATATYGSELSPEVQFLRGFRDGTVMSTFAGSGFMKAFNAWYYSFSPNLADFISKQPLLKEAMKILLYPLIGILHISALTYSALSFNPELAIVAIGIVASGLIGIIYFTPFNLITLLCMKRHRKFRLNPSHLKNLTAIWIASIALICLAEVTATQPVMMAATAILVLSTLTLTALATTQRIIQKLT